MGSDSEPTTSYESSWSKCVNETDDEDTNMKRTLYPFLLFTLLVSIPSHAQTAEDSVVAVITGFFDAMRASDSAAARTAFTPGAQLYRALPARLAQNSVDGIIGGIGSPKDSVWNEVIWDTEVRIDGNLASVWTQYAFFVGPRLNHCGVDAFQLYRQTDGWKIYMITDTMRQAGCSPPPNR